MLTNIYIIHRQRKDQNKTKGKQRAKTTIVLLKKNILLSLIQSDQVLHFICCFSQTMKHEK